MELEVYEGELKEIRHIVSLAKEDKDIKELLLKEISTELDIEEIEEAVFEEKVKKIIEEAKGDSRKMNILIDMLLKDGEIYAILDEHFHTYFEEIGEIKEAM